MRALAVIPARYKSTRFPGKPLQLITGRPMVQWVYEAAKDCKDLSRVIVATDDTRIAEAVDAFGGEALMTRDDHVSGFDRIVEVANKFPEFTHYVNVQGDEPLLPAANISGALHLFNDSKTACEIATTAVAFQNEADIRNENQVKVVLAADKSALYFSRSPIPFYRSAGGRETLPTLKHQGLYAYSRKALLSLAKLPVSPLEEAESLEQLRFLYHGFKVHVHVADVDSPGVDTPEDLARVERMIVSRNG
jgi:3-deoxy-manno-octulosonate cytidylyltransferase (CMP-KDO synthetase)